MRQVGKLVNWALIVGTLIGILQPAFFENKSLTQIIISLFEPEATQGFAMRWLLFIVFLSAMYVIAVDFIYRRQPLTVIRTRFEINHLSRDGSIVEINREQLLRANRPGVTAYFTRHTPDTSTGRIPGSGITGTLFSAHHSITSVIEKYGSDESGYEVFQIFNMALPYKWYMPLIPVRIMNKPYDDIPRFLRKNITVRRQKVRYENEYNVPDPSVDFTSYNYKQLNLTIIIAFIDSVPDDIRIRRVQNAAVVEVRFERIDGEHKVRVYLEKLHRDERIKITWTSWTPPGAIS